MSENMQLTSPVKHVNNKGRGKCEGHNIKEVHTKIIVWEQGLNFVQELTFGRYNICVIIIK